MEMRRLLFGILVFFVSFGFCFSVQPEKPDYIMNDRRIFEEARISFEVQEYGNCLNLCERAEYARRAKTEWEVYTLKNSFKPAEVKIRGDVIDDVVPVLEERQDFDALEIIDRYRKYYGLERFDFSCKNLIDFIKSRKSFPEASFLKGRVYHLEGEYDVAEKLFLQALENSSILDVPDERYDILYALSEINFTQNDFRKYEEYLLLILSEDSAYRDSSLIAAMRNTIESKKSDCMEKFFKMYRAGNYRLLRAYFSLAGYYLSKNERKKALTCVSLGSLTAFTKIYDIVSKRNPEFEYSGFSELLKEASTYSDIVEWGKNNDVWKGFNDFADEAYRSSCPIFSVNLYSALKNSSPEEYWRLDAEKKLEKINGDSQ